MSRPFQTCKIGFAPRLTFFKPAEIPRLHLTEICLTPDERKAVQQLADLHGPPPGTGGPVQSGIGRRGVGSRNGSRLHQRKKSI